MFSRFLNLLLLSVLATAAWARGEEAAPSTRRGGQGVEHIGEAVIEARFKRLDADQDGRLSAEESRPVAALIAGADADGDGFFTLDEVKTHFRKQAEGARGPMRDLVRGIIEPGIDARFKSLDRNGDGRIAGEELAQARWLSRMDENADGAVTLEEMSSFFANFVVPEPSDAASEAPEFYALSEDSPRQQPKLMKPSEAGVGRKIPDVKFVDLDGKGSSLREAAGRRVTVLALISPDCPVSKRYLPSLAVLGRELQGTGGELLVVAPTATDTPESLRRALAAAGLEARCVPDPTGTFSRMLGARVTTDVFVLDARLTLRYRGALDDQYGLGYSLEAPRRRYAAEAVAAVLAGREPEIGATEAPGCALDFSEAKTVAALDGATYHNRISRILQASCIECHRQGGVAPFPLETYEQVSAKAGMVRRMVERKLMPPWFAAPHAEGGSSPWSNDRSLAAEDREALLGWLASGRPLGNPADAPLPRAWPGEWEIGKPDAVYQIPKAIAVKATGTMPYQNVLIETGLEEDRWVEAIEVQPTAREVVHHVLVFVREKGSARGRRFVQESEETGGFFAAYVPGNSYVSYPEGFAKALPAGAQLHFQIHYTPNGVAAQDQVRLGVRYAKTPPRHVVQVAGIENLRLKIPPGAEHHPESGTLPVPYPVRVIGFMPHMHVRGKAFRYEVILPGGEVRTLLDVPRYDFNWQLAYRYAEPMFIPKGSKLRATGWFDNSANNPANPDPTKTVRWGPQTTDEMMLGYVEYYVLDASS
jgi:peroxiredoxin